MSIWLWWVACSGGGDKNEVCNDEIPYDGIDQDCDGADLADVDADGFDAVTAGGEDCDDDNAAIFPDAEEIPYDGLDQDCLDGDLLDADLDSYASVDHGGDDCDDADSAVHPDASDSFGNSVDENCDGLDGVDSDADGFASVPSGGPDCDDGNPALNPDAVEIWHDGVDQNCDQQCDGDEDGDGAVYPGTPVNNGSPCDTTPGPEVYAPEDCDDQNPLVTRMDVDEPDPEDEEVGVLVTSTIRAYYSGDDANPIVTLTDSASGAIPGVVSVGSSLITFTPDVPLAYLETYTLQIDHACGSFVSSFTTEDEPVPVDINGLLTRTYEVDFGEGDWVQPAGVGDLLASQLGDTRVYAEVTAVGTDTLDMRFALGAGGAQDICSETTDVLGIDFTANPYLVATIPVLSLDIGGFEIALDDARISGRFQSDSAAIVNASLQAEIDTVPLGDAFGLGSDPDATCTLVSAFGVSCITCADGSSDYCLDIVIEGLYLPEIALDLVPRTADDIANDVSCP